MPRFVQLWFALCLLIPLIPAPGIALAQSPVSVALPRSYTPSPVASHTDRAPGWTRLTRAPDTLCVFVSSSQGNDRNDGLTPDSPVQTLGRAYQLLRPRHPDWILLKRGDVFPGNFPDWAKSGRSAKEPLIITAYDVGPRPVIIPARRSKTLIRKSVHHDVEHLWFVGLEFYAQQADPAAPEFDPDHELVAAFLFRGRGEDLLIEDCVFRFFPGQILVEGHHANVRIRRNIIVDAYATGGHPKGGFFHHVAGLLIEGNLFDHNGWNPHVAGAEPTIFRHNLYLKECTDTVIRNNVFARGASFGLKISSDHPQAMQRLLIEHNLFVENANGLSVGHSAGYAEFAHTDVTIRHNVFTRLGRLIRGEHPEKFGISVSTANRLLIDANCFIDNPTAARQPAIELDPKHPHSNARVCGNVVHGWALYPRRKTLVLPDTVAAEQNRIEPASAVLADAERTVDTYAAHLDLPDFDAVLHAARRRGPGLWPSCLTAATINAYLAQGLTPETP